jgi:hypothetical protein
VSEHIEMDVDNGSRVAAPLRSRRKTRNVRRAQQQQQQQQLQQQRGAEERPSATEEEAVACRRLRWHVRGALTCYVRGCRLSACVAQATRAAQARREARREGLRLPGGGRRVLVGGAVVRAAVAKQDPRVALRSFMEQLLGEPPDDDMWYSTNHHDDGFVTMVSIHQVAEFAEFDGKQPNQELGCFGRERPTPQEAERAAAHFMLARLADYIQWE